ncbi:MAG: DUF4179 domain-containing protein [Clostridia bacterium]|nr:DUF4179 domain-containing protein [Clostridia bacterium]
MKNEVYKKQMKKIRPSDELIEKTIQNIKNVNKLKNTNKVKNGIRLRKLVAGTAAVLTLSVGSVGAYIAITGNSLLSILGLEKASINYENESVAIPDQYNTVIENEYTKIKLEKIACDETFLILEYNVKIKDAALTEIQNKNENFIAETDYDYSRGTNSVNLGLSESFYINGKNINGYSCIAQKIENIENEYKFYDIVNIMDIKEKNLKVSVTILSVRIDGYQFMVTDANNNYLLDLSINGNNNEKFESVEYKNNNEEVIVKNVMNTSFATYVTVGVNVSDISSENCLNKINFNSKNSNNEEIESHVFLKKYVIRTEDDIVYDVITDSVGTSENDYVKDSYLLNSRNKEKADNIVTFDKAFSKGIAELEYVILYPNIIPDDNIINCLVTRNGKTIVENMNIDIRNEFNSNCVINDISLVNYTDKKVADFRNTNEYMNNEENYIVNEYYNENAEKIDSTNYEICGITLGMSADEALQMLQKYYDKNNIDIVCSNYYDNSSYDDGHMSFSTQDNKVNFVNAYDFDGVNNNKLKVSDVINRYYSEEKLIRTNEHGKNNALAILYGIDDYISNENSKEDEYAYVNLDSAGRITCLVYKDKENSITFGVDAATKTITNIFIFD